jgi:hypothetical protein
MTDARVATANAVLVGSSASHVAPPTGSGAGIEAYLASAERTRVIAGTTVYVTGALIVLIMFAWALGLLPGAVRLF